MFLNIVFEDSTDDVDIVYIPDNMINKIDLYAQDFCDWLNSNRITTDYYVVVNGRKFINLDTEGFVRWLNKYICLGDDKAYIVEQHTRQQNCYKTIDF